MFCLIGTPQKFSQNRYPKLLYFEPEFPFSKLSFRVFRGVSFLEGMFPSAKLPMNIRPPGREQWALRVLPLRFLAAFGGVKTVFLFFLGGGFIYDLEYLYMFIYI